MSRGMPSMTALLALLAMAGYQNRDKIAEIIGGLTQGNANPPGTLPGQRAPEAETEDGGLGGLGGLLGGLLGGAAAGGAASQSGGLGGMLGGGQSPDAVAHEAAKNPADTLNRGVGDLIDHFRQSGLGEEADSWVSSGPNKELQPSQIENSLDPQIIDALAQQLGVSREELLGRLAQNLPTAVQKFSSGF